MMFVVKVDVIIDLIKSDVSVCQVHEESSRFYLK